MRVNIRRRLIDLRGIGSFLCRCLYYKRVEGQGGWERENTKGGQAKTINN